MANRSYLYSINEVPGSKPEQTLNLKGLSEFKYDTPLAYLLLVSGGTEVCDSLIEEAPEKISLAGRYQEGLDNLKAFLDLVAQSSIHNQQLFQQQYAETMAFLNQVEVVQDYIYLDLGELYSMTESNEADSLVYRIEETLEHLKNKDVSKMELCLYEEKSLQSDWEECLGINNWGEALYFDFPKPFLYKTPFKVNEINKVDLTKQTSELSDLAKALQRIK